MNKKIKQSDADVVKTEDEKKKISEYNFDVPKAFDEERLYKDILSIKNGNEINVPIYSFITHERDKQNTTRVKPNKVIIFEGILLFQ